LLFVKLHLGGLKNAEKIFLNKLQCQFHKLSSKKTTLLLKISPSAHSVLIMQVPFSSSGVMLSNICKYFICFRRRLRLWDRKVTRHG